MSLAKLMWQMECRVLYGTERFYDFRKMAGVGWMRPTQDLNGWFYLEQEFVQ